MKLVVLGTGPFAVPSLRALEASPHAVAQVVCRPPRGRRSEPPAPVRLAAEELGLPVWTPESANSPESQAQLRTHEADLMVVCDYGEILKRDTLAVTRLGGVNLHGSLLPRYRGAAPVQWALIHGDTETGVTAIHMTPKLDAGPILGLRRVEIDPDEDAGELEARLAILGADLMLETVSQLESGESISIPQEASQACPAPKLAKADGLIDWTLSAGAIKNRVRGARPWPRAFTFWRRESAASIRLTIDRVKVIDADADAPPGVVVETDGELRVAAGAGQIGILQIQPAGKRSMAAADFLRGTPMTPGDLLGGERP